eukprot:scaffold1960_cov242-Pinguiococcus_pyrenoidosus.AAC.1
MDSFEQGEEEGVYDVVDPADAFRQPMPNRSHAMLGLWTVAECDSRRRRRSSSLQNLSRSLSAFARPTRSAMGKLGAGCFQCHQCRKGPVDGVCEQSFRLPEDRCGDCLLVAVVQVAWLMHLTAVILCFYTALCYFVGDA